MIKLLDCTLRDGGYINNWEFGYSAIKDMIEQLESTNVDILELGFLKNEVYDKNRTVFNDMKQISILIPRKKQGMAYAAMIEVVNPIPLDMLEECTEKSVDIIRVIIWKTKYDENGNIEDALQEGYEYCKGIVEKGYKLCVQPARVEQYSDDEFVNMLEMFQKLNPMAVYVVDSWGTQNAEQIMHYVELADIHLKEDIAIGYHGHNNMMQALGTASRFVKEKKERNLMIDASVYGIGRGAGNLNLELFAKYLNDTEKKNYNISPMLYIYEKYMKKIFEEHPWGYSISYYLTAEYQCNPNYGEYYNQELGLSEAQIAEILSEITEEDRIIFNRKKARKYAERYLN